jgi:hypothetical protein
VLVFAPTAYNPTPQAIILSACCDRGLIFGDRIEIMPTSAYTHYADFWIMPTIGSKRALAAAIAASESA